jgi:hypothetical protein
MHWTIIGILESLPAASPLRSLAPKPHAGAIFVIATYKTNVRGFQREATPLLHRSLLRIACSLARSRRSSV